MRTALFAAAVLLGSMPAAGLTQHLAHAPTIRIRYSAHQLSTADGRRALDRQLTAAVAHVCADKGRAGIPIPLGDYIDCRDKALRDARGQVRRASATLPVQQVIATAGTVPPAPVR